MPVHSPGPPPQPEDVLAALEVSRRCQKSDTRVFQPAYFRNQGRAPVATIIDRVVIVRSPTAIIGRFDEGLTLNTFNSE